MKAARQGVGLILCLVLLFHGAPRKPIELSVTPSGFAFAPATIRVQVRIQPVDSDRAVWVVVDAENYYGESDWNIPGAASPHLFHPIEFRDLPAGAYVIFAAIGRYADGKQLIRSYDRAFMTLLGVQ